MTINITVRTLTGTKIIAISEDITISQLKSKIENVFGFSPNEQRLLFDNKIIGKDNEKINNFGIKNGSVINLSIIFSKFNVAIQLLDGQKFEIEVTPNQTVANLKSKIKDASSIPIDEQTLLYKGNVLVDGNSLSSSGIIDYCGICLIMKLKETMRLLIEVPKGKRYTYEVNRTETIRGMKLKIQEILKINLDDHELVYPGIIFNDDKVISECGIPYLTKIPIIFQPKGLDVCVRMLDGSKEKITINTNVTIRDLKLKIYEKLKFEPDDQRLVFQGILLDDVKTAYDYRICSQSEIYVVVRPKKLSRIFIKGLSGESISVTINKNETIHDLKIKIQELLNISPDAQKLIFQGVVLTDDKSIEEHGISSESIINLLKLNR